ncbi:MAG: lipoprotein-releasing ABC transporter permease subunit [Pasteurellaceae bacterium]|nr:lipoprotein-releasing ABC transporter permease subunit [Pasteurellaceae bacterium]
MNMPISLFIALRYWRAKSADQFGRLVTRLASSGIVLGVMALIIVLSVMNGLENHQKQQILSSLPHAILKAKQGYFNLNDPMPATPKFVQKIVPINRTNVILQSAQGVSAGQVIGIQQFSDDPQLNQFKGENIQDYLPAGEFKLLIGAQLADNLHLQVGSKVRLIISENSQYTPFGRVPVQRLFTVSDIVYGEISSSGVEVFANLSDIGRLMHINPTQVQGYRLFLADPFQITQLSTFYPENQYVIDDWRSEKGEFFQAVRMEKNMMGLLISLIVVVAVSNIITSLSLMVVDKQGEIAILQTQGLTKGQVRNVFVLQGFLVGILGTFIGALLGIIVTLNLDNIINLINPLGIHLPTDIDWIQVAMIILFSLLLSLLSTIYPAYRAAQVEPATALRYE